MGNAKSLSLPRLQSIDQDRLDAWIQLFWCQARLMRLLEQTLAQQDITLPQFDVLSNLAIRDGLTQQELAARLQSTKGNVCGLITRLETAGWVERCSDPSDGRANRVRLTRAGRAVVSRCRPIHDRMVGRILSECSQTDLAALRKVLAQMEAGADAVQKDLLKP